MEYNEFIGQLQILKKNILENEDKLYKTLSVYQSHEVTEDEIFKSIDTIENIDVEKDYLTGCKKLEKLSVFFPLNLQLYSLFIFAIVPGFLFKNVYIRPPQHTGNLLSDIAKIIGLEEVFPHIQVLPQIERGAFMDQYVKQSQAVMFTGTYGNANKVMTSCNPDTIFIYHGAGINPVVVDKDANLEDSIHKIIRVKTFNSGQDCAGSDAILVHKEIKQEFLKVLYRELDKIKVGPYTDKDVVVGSIGRAQHLEDISKYLVNNHDKILYGGNIDYKNIIIQPTVVDGDFNNIRYDELFAPIFYILTYSSDEDLNTYFSHQIYQKHAMYISAFGSSKHLLEKKYNSTIIHDDIIMNIERGNREFGGYGEYASFIRVNKKSYRHPILISRDLKKYTEGL